MSELAISDRLLNRFEEVLGDLDITLQLISKERSFKNPDYYVHYPDRGRINLIDEAKQLEQSAIDMYNRLVILGRGNDALYKCLEYGFWPTD